jgi:hypothetical protein
VLVEDDYTYGRTLKRYWRENKRFINIEHDIVPWPGACEEMWECDYGYCTYQYPIGYSGKFGMSLGMVMLDPAIWELPDEYAYVWDEYTWNNLDGAVFGSMRDAHYGDPHIHTPPVAHLTPLKTPNVGDC